MLVNVQTTYHILVPLTDVTVNMSKDFKGLLSSFGETFTLNTKT